MNFTADNKNNVKYRGPACLCGRESHRHVKFWIIVRKKSDYDPRTPMTTTPIRNLCRSWHRFEQN